MDSLRNEKVLRGLKNHLAQIEDKYSPLFSDVDMDILPVFTDSEVEYYYNGNDSDD